VIEADIWRETWLILADRLVAIARARESASEIEAEDVRLEFDAHDLATVVRTPRVCPADPLPS
jgi:hypothetical protein